MMPAVIEAFLEWWSSPSSNVRFPDSFLKPIRYRRGGEMDDEDAVWIIGQSLGHTDVEIVSETHEGGCSRIELVCIDPVTLLRHRVRLEIVTDGDRIASVVEHSEIIHQRQMP